MTKKRGQTGSGTGAATLVAVITLLIVLYILFIPPESREELLELNTTLSEDGSQETIPEDFEPYNKTLTLACEGIPGRVDYIAQKEVEHNIPATTIMTRTSAAVIKEIRSIYVKNSLFSDKIENISFSIEDISNTKNVLLSFLVKERSGRLIIRLNSHEVYNNEILSENINPVVLPKEYLQPQNIIEISTSKIGMVFWKNHEYSLENVLITADLTSVDTQESKTVFLVGSSEKDNLDKAKIRFVADKCDESSPGKIYVTLNGYTIYSGIPDLNTPLTYEFTAERLFGGENEIRFRVDKGCYLIDQITLKSELKEAFQPFCSFELSEDEYDDIAAGREDINISLTFGVDLDAQGIQVVNEGKMFINNHARNFYTRSLEERWVINSYVEEGYNSIKIVPRNKMYINKLEAEIY